MSDYQANMQADRAAMRTHISRCKALEVAQRMVEDCHYYDDDRRDMAQEAAEVIVVAEVLLTEFLEKP